MSADDMLIARLDNWGRWTRAYRRRIADPLLGYPIPCASLESQYRSPQRWDAPPSGARGRVHPEDAWRVEIAWRTLCGSPQGMRHGLTLRLHYCLRWRPADVCRAVTRAGHGRVRDYRAELIAAQSSLALALERTEEANRHMLRSIVRRLLDVVVPEAYRTCTTRPFRHCGVDPACGVSQAAASTKQHEQHVSMRAVCISDAR